MNTGFCWVMKALLSHYWRHPWQTLFLTIGLVSGVALWSAVQIINHHAEDSYQQAQNLLGAQAQYWIRSRRDQGVEAQVYVELRRAGFRQVFPMVELEVSTAAGVSIKIIATDLLALPDNAFDSDESDEIFPTAGCSLCSHPIVPGYHRCLPVSWIYLQATNSSCAMAGSCRPR